MGVHGCKAVETTGHTDESDQLGSPLSGAESTRYRAVVARGIYMGFDRPDMQFAIKEVAKAMAMPTTNHVTKLKRLAKYVNCYSNAEIVYRWGCWDSTILGYSDSDWAGDRESRRSTSGGCLTLGGCILKSWSRTQRHVALSSGKAELYAAMRASQELMGIQALSIELGMNLKCNLRIDAKATMGMVCRRGVGQLRHIAVQDLWIQEVMRDRKVAAERVTSADNVADMMTKYVPAPVMERHLQKLGIYHIRAQRM